jgi:hypothetical protein
MTGIKKKKPKGAAAKADRSVAIIKRSLIGAAVLVFTILFVTGWNGRGQTLSDFKGWCLNHKDRPAQLTAEQADTYCSCLAGRLGAKITPFDSAISRATLHIYNPAGNKRENFDLNAEAAICSGQPK